MLLRVGHLHAADDDVGHLGGHGHQVVHAVRRRVDALALLHPATAAGEALTADLAPLLAALGWRSYGAHVTGCARGGWRTAFASAGDHAERKDAPAGGPGSSSTPGAHSHATHPTAGPDRTRQQPQREHSAAVPCAVMLQ
jgi:hypothetical protein